jgi:alpha-L-rhamnosidase
MEWFYADLAGIASDPAGPGFKKILLRPQPVGDVTWVKCAYDSVRGRIQSNWKRARGRFYWTVTIPANTTATVFVPAREAQSVTEGGVDTARSPNVRFLRQEDGRAVYEIGSGTYHFAAE